VQHVEAPDPHEVVATTAPRPRVGHRVGSVRDGHEAADAGLNGPDDALLALVKDVHGVRHAQDEPVQAPAQAEDVPLVLHDLPLVHAMRHHHETGAPDPRRRRGHDVAHDPALVDHQQVPAPEEPEQPAGHVRASTTS
jgi:hypothetical protein